MFKYIGTIIFVFICVTSVVLFLFLSGPLNTNSIVKIQKNTSIKKVVSILTVHHIIRRDKIGVLILEYALRIFHLVPKAGVYYFKSHQSLWDVLTLILRGKVYMERFTLIGGWSKAILKQHLMVLPYFSKVKNMHLKEGIYMPDTYDIKVGMSVQVLLDTMHRHMIQTVRKFWNTCQVSKVIHNVYEGIILASIVQKEAGNVKDMPMVAKIFINRLGIRMPLQSDVTVLYALYHGNHSSKPLTFKNLKIKSPYNTYIHYGLPPHPISYPDKDALSSVFCNHSTSDKLYFVYDHDNVIHTSRTFQEHWHVARLKLNRS